MMISQDFLLFFILIYIDEFNIEMKIVHELINKFNND